MRRLIYITNAAEGFDRMFRKYTKTKTNFSGDDSLSKSIYISVKEISKKWYNSVIDFRNYAIYTLYETFSNR